MWPPAKSASRTSMTQTRSLLGLRGGTEQRQRRSVSSSGGRRSWALGAAPKPLERSLRTATLHKPAAGPAGAGDGPATIFINVLVPRSLYPPPDSHPRRSAFTRAGASTVTAEAHAIVATAGGRSAAQAQWCRPVAKVEDCTQTRSGDALTHPFATMVGAARTPQGTPRPCISNAARMPPTAVKLSGFGRAKLLCNGVARMQGLQKERKSTPHRCRRRRHPSLPLGRPRWRWWVATPASRCAGSARGRSRRHAPWRRMIVMG